MELADVVPWGRSLEEYRLMFSLGESDLNGRLLGCGDGPASVNAELRALNIRNYISVDPIYLFSAAEIEARVQQSYESIVSQVKANPNPYVWSYFPDPDTLGAIRLATMRRFLTDFELGRAENRYIPAQLPNLPFSNSQFDLCLCSHLLFLYSKQLSYSFHLASILELLRVADQVRIFPLFDLDCQPSVHLTPIQSALDDKGFESALVTVPYEFQKGANQMLRILNRKHPRTPRFLPTVA